MTLRNLTLEPSFSSAGRFITCSWPWGRTVEGDGVGNHEAAEYGTDWHTWMAKLLCGQAPDLDRECSDPKMAAHLKESWGVLRKWLDKGNAYKAQWLKQPVASRGVEASIALNLVSGVSRWCAPPDEHHVYTDRRDEELPGTIDFFAIDKGRLLVLDHKTGFSVDNPTQSDQLKTAAVALLDRYKKQLDTRRLEIVLTLFHAPRTSLPIILDEPIGYDALEKHQEELLAAHKRRGSGLLRVSSECGYCAARPECPTMTSTLAQLKVPQTALTSERVGEIHQQLALYDKLSDNLRERIRAWVTEHGPAIRPDGKVVDFVTRAYSNLSQASIRRALGSKADSMIDMLKASGCIEEGEREELRAVNDR